MSCFPAHFDGRKTEQMILSSLRSASSSKNKVGDVSVAAFELEASAGSSLAATVSSCRERGTGLTACYNNGGESDDGTFTRLMGLSFPQQPLQLTFAVDDFAVGRASLE